MIDLRTFLAALILVLTGETAVHACAPTHKVVPGDTLWDIARDEMGTAWSYPQIALANQDIISDPALIYVGDVLDIPCLTGALGEINWSVMPTPQAYTMLADATDIQVLDIRSADEIAGGTIPGSLWMPYDIWRGPEDNPGAPHDAGYYAQFIGAAGLRLDRPTMIVHAENTPMSTGASAYVYWVLKSLGAQEMAILRGGYDAWEAFGGPVAALPAETQPYSVELTFASDWRATDAEVLSVAAGDAPGSLLDARPHAMFNVLNDLGIAIETTIPGAKSLPTPPLMAALEVEFNIEDGVDTVIEYYRARGALDQPGDVIVFCKSGQMSALNWFYASELASIENVRLYPESLIGWGQSFGVLAVGET